MEMDIKISCLDPLFKKAPTPYNKRRTPPTCKKVSCFPPRTETNPLTTHRKPASSSRAVGSEPVDLVGLLQVVAAVGLPDAVEPDVGHLLVADVVRVDAVADEVFRRGAVFALHVDEDDALAVELELVGDLAELAVEVDDALLDGGVAVDEEGGEDHGGLGGLLEQVVEQVGDAVAGAGEVVVADAVVGADVDEDQVRLELGHGLGGLVVDHGYRVALPALGLVVLHVARRVVADHVDLVAVVLETVPQVLAVPVLVCRPVPVRDGRAQRHDPQRHAVREAPRPRCDDAAAVVIPG